MSPLGLLSPIDLPELMSRAALQTRTDRKYVLPVGEALDLLDRLDRSTRVLEIDGDRSFRYQSVYFDTPDLASFRLAAHRRRRRFKIRTRVYVDSAQCWLEVKTEGYRGGTVKDRIPYALHDQDCVTPGLGFLESVLGPCADVAFDPTLVTRYRRATLFVPADSSRATVDTELTWEDSAGRSLRLPSVAVVETKTGSAASQVDRLLWARGHRPAPISKYATGLAALRPELPSAPWRRTLRRYFVT